MRGLSTLYLCACEREGCLSNSQLVKMFAELDQYSPADDIMQERQKRSWLGQEVDHPTTRFESLLPQRACPTTLDFTQNYLGDAGLAAVFRVLPLMRWVKKIIARGCGAGTQSVKALCDILTMELPTVYDRTKDRTIGMPLIALECVDLRDNALFVASGRLLCKALESRRRVTARLKAEVPPIEVLVDYTGFPPSVANWLEALLRVGHDDKRNRELERKRQEEHEQVKLFCIEGTGCVLQPMGENMIYRIPEYMPNETGGADAEPLLFYDSSNPQLSRLVREINQHMEDYLVAFKCLSKRVLTMDGTGAGEIQHARAAAQLCVELGAETLSFIPFTNASVWFEHGVQWEDPALVALLAQEEMRKTMSSGRLSGMPSLCDMVHLQESSRSHSGEGQRQREADNRKTELELRYAEINANVGALLRGFYANPHLEGEVVAHRGATLAHYIKRLKELFYESVVPEEDPDALADRMQLLESLYARVVAALTTQSMSDLPSMAPFEERLHDIRLYMVEEMLVGTEVADLMRLQRAIRQERIPPVPYETTRWVVDARSANLPPPRPWRDEMITTQLVSHHNTGALDAVEALGHEREHNITDNETTGGWGVAGTTSPYRRVWPLWCTEMKYFLFNHVSHRHAWNREYVPRERKNWVVPPPSFDHRKRPHQSRLIGASSISGALRSSLQSPGAPSHSWSSNRQTPYLAGPHSSSSPCTDEKRGATPFTLGTPPRQTRLSSLHEDIEGGGGEEEEEEIMRGDVTMEDEIGAYQLEMIRRASVKDVENNDEEEYCYEEEEDEEDETIGVEGPEETSHPATAVHRPIRSTAAEHNIPIHYRSLVMCTCRQRLKKDFPPRSPSSARPRHLPRPCPSCCYASLAILPGFLSDPLVRARLEIQEKVRDALPMEIKVFFLDMILSRRSRSAYVPRIFGVGTRLRRDGHLTCSDHNNTGDNTVPRLTSSMPMTRDRHIHGEDSAAEQSTSRLPQIPPRHLVSIVDFFAAVDGKRDRMMELLSGFEEWYRLKMVESFDVAYPYLARPRFSRSTTSGSEQSKT